MTESVIISKIWNLANVMHDDVIERNLFERRKRLESYVEYIVHTGRFTRYW